MELILPDHRGGTRIAVPPDKIRLGMAQLRDELYRVAHDLLDVRLADPSSWSVFPLRRKSPKGVIRWGAFQLRRARPKEFHSIFYPRRIHLGKFVDGLGVVTGKISGRNYAPLCVRDFDDPAAYCRWAADNPKLAA